MGCIFFDNMSLYHFIRDRDSVCYHFTRIETIHVHQSSVPKTDLLAKHVYFNLWPIQWNTVIARCLGSISTEFVLYQNNTISPGPLKTMGHYVIFNQTYMITTGYAIVVRKASWEFIF